MKGSSIASAVIGTTFFAVPYLAFSLPVVPSLIIGSAAFAAGKLVFHKEEVSEELRIKTKTKEEILNEAKELNRQITDKIELIDDSEIKNNLKEITMCVSKIVATCEKYPSKMKNLKSFFDYYLPLTVKIVSRYDEIENQGLGNKETKKFMNDTNDMVKRIKDSFIKILEKLYESDIVDIDADIKVFSQMLKAEGYDEIEIKGDK